MAREGTFDIFLSYHWQDRAVVEPIARALRQRGITPFLDRWYLTPGQPWITALQTILDRCKAVAVFIGSQGMGRWQQREAQLALDRQASDVGFPVIPVLLPAGDPALGFLMLNTWVDLRHGTRESDLDLLALAIRGEAPGPDFIDRVLATRATICPYRGLRPFREEDAAFFCGREAFTDMLIEAVRQRSFVAVIGASGSGKSSVVRAGLTPYLRRQGKPGSSMWDVVTMIPRDQPLNSLAAAVMPLLKPDLDIINRRNEANRLAGYWANGTTRLSDTIHDALQLQPGTDQLLLIVDQWEELYTLCKDDTQRRRFADELLAASNEPRLLTVVLTLRGDFFGHALNDRKLADRMQNGVVTLGPMTREELRRAVEEPAQQVGLTFEDGLVARILDEVGDEPGNLPLLEFVLEMLWERRQGRELHHSAYEEIGKVQGAIAKRADETFARLLPEQHQVARRALTKLVRPGEGTEDTRRRVLIDELGTEAASVIETFVSARLLVAGLDRISGNEMIEVTHEALIQHWAQLRKWVDEDRDFLRTRDRLEAAAQYWQLQNRDTSLLLSPGRPLAEGEDLLTNRRQDLGPGVSEYIQASSIAHQKKLQAEREAEQRRMDAEREAEHQRIVAEAARGSVRRTHRFSAALGLLFLIAIGFGVRSYQLSLTAARERDIAEQASRQAEELGKENEILAKVLRLEYEQLFAETAIPPEQLQKVDAAVNTLVSNKSRYETVTADFGIPWYMIGVIHMLEAGFNFNGNLLNGDPLTARTVHVPAGRPPTGTPPFTWEESAVDFIRLEGLDKWKDWSIPGVLVLWERTNGMGYRRHGIRTPYVWACTNMYSKGKYAADGTFDPNAVAKGCGGAAILRHLVDLGIVTLD